MAALLQELVQTGIYKRTQGRITRQVTFAAIALTIAIGLYRMHELLRLANVSTRVVGIEYWLPGLLLVAGVWIAYRLVNIPGCADFLIGVEAEMSKVSWPTRTELVRASLVVLALIFALAILLFVYDTLWGFFFKFVVRIH